jgi:hypothetical protein
MNTPIPRIALFILAGALSAPAGNAAAPQTNPTAVSLDAGTLGFGASIWHSFSETFSINGGYNWFDYSKDVTTSDVNYNGKLQLSNFPLMLNWHPKGGTFRLVGGLVIADNKVDVVGQPAANSTYEINGSTYTAAQVGTLKGTGDFGNAVAPYLGLGWTTHRTSRGLGFFADLGLMFSGSPEVKLSASGPISTDATFQSNLAQEVRKLNDEVDEAKVYPVIRLGLMYRF